MRIIPFWLGLVLVLDAQDFANQWRTLNDEARSATGLKRVQALRVMNQLVPGNARLLLALASALDPDEEALRLRKSVASAGIVMDAMGNEELAKAVSRNRLPASSAIEITTLPGSDWIAEDLVATGQGFLVSSVRRAAILNTNGSVFARTDLSVFGLGMDKSRQWVWAALGWTPHCEVCSAGSKGRGALVAYDLKSGSIRKRIDSIALNDLTVSSDGDVYVTSNAGASLFVLPAGGSQLERIGSAGEFPSPQGSTLSSDEKTLYTADYRRGVVAIDLETKQMKWLQPSPDMVVNGIDGLYLHKNLFYAIQNGVSPVRILQLSTDLKRQKVLEANWEGLGEPTHGTVAGNRFCFLANTGWDAFDEDGRKKPNLPAIVTKIYCRPLP